MGKGRETSEPATLTRREALKLSGVAAAVCSLSQDGISPRSRLPTGRHPVAAPWRTGSLPRRRPARR